MMILIAVAAALFDPGAWTILDERSALDGQRSYIAGVESAEDLRDTAGLPEKAQLSLNCVGGRRTVAILWPAYLGSEDVMVRWKFDDGDVQRRSVQVLRGGRNALIDGRAADAFINQVARARTVVIEVSGYTGAQEAVFDVAGADEVVGGVREACEGR